MRLVFSSALAAALLASAGLVMAGNALRNRAPTRIPAEPLGLALRTLASERGFQVVYVSGQVDAQKSRGASGELTVDEALAQLLRGTGMSYQRLPDGGVVIAPIASRAAASLLPRQAAAAYSASQGSSSRAEPAQLGAITIEASKEQQTLRRQVAHFIASVVARPLNDAPYRWNEPVCPLVAGLSKAAGEFILARISTAAREAHAPLAGKVCHPNLYVVASAEPEVFLEKERARNWRMFGVFDAADAHEPGVEAVERFVHSRRPIRVWYNTGLSCNESAAPGAWASTTAMGGYGSSGNAATGLAGFGLSGLTAPVCGGADTRLIRTSTWSNITSAIVVVDLRRVKHVAIQQLADYVALVGLAGVREDANPDPQPSVLQLFGHASAPPGLSPWDRALLFSLYNTNDWDKLQVSEMQSAMLKRIAP